MLADISRTQKILVMLGVMTAMFLAALDQTIVATAMPKVVADLKGFEYLSWVFTAYMLSSTVSVPIYGKLSDMYGRKYFILGAIVIFLIGSVLSGFSQNMFQLIVFRAIQGIGGGAIFANAFAIIGDLFAPAERGKWQGMFGSVFGLSSVVGPLVGGWLTDNVSWRWNFFVNLPVGLIAFIAVLFLMPKIVPNARKKVIDYYGSASLALALSTLLLGVVWGGGQYPWISFEIISLFSLSAFSLFLFVISELRSKEPVLPLKFFKNPIFLVTMLVVFLSGVGMFGAILFVPLYAQLVLGVSATNSGTILTPLMLSMVASSITTGQIVSRTGRYKLIAIFGLGLATTAIFLLSRMSTETTSGQLLIRMVMTGLGVGITLPVFTLVVQNAFPHSDLGVVTASTQLFRSIGATIGTALLGGILNSNINSRIQQFASDPFLNKLSRTNPQLSPAGIDSNKLQALLTGPGRLEIENTAAFGEFLYKTKVLFAGSITKVFLVISFIMLLAFFISFFLKEIPLRKSQQEKPKSAA